MTPLNNEKELSLQELEGSKNKRNDSYEKEMDRRLHRRILSNRYG